MKNFLVILLAVLALAAGFFTLAKFGYIGHAPQIVLKRDLDGTIVATGTKAPAGKKLGIRPDFQASRPVCWVETSLQQNQHKVLLKHPASEDVSLLGFQEGPAELTVVAEDCSIFHRRTKRHQALELDFTPPSIHITSSQHFINQGGANVVTYTVSPDAAWSGVTVGPYRFQGHKKPGVADESGEHFAFFVFSYDLPANEKIEVTAFDPAGNMTTATLTPAKFFPHTFRHRELAIDDKFIDSKVVDIIAHTPGLKDQGDRLKNFLLVNRDLRRGNARFLVDLSKKSEEKFYWKDAFKPLGNAAIEANFADYRNYMYQGQKVDEQVHLGFDMAVTEKYPIHAANAGKVAFAGYLGVYGNTVVIDHGYGLMTLYGHLSSMDVKPGDLVAEDQPIGRSGDTGLAGGDHLHFSLLIDGVQTNPVEFWDQHWIDDNVYLRVGKDSSVGLSGPKNGSPTL